MNAYNKLQALIQRKNRLWAAHRAALCNRIARVHPATNGHIGLVHNWGNAAAREAVSKAQARWDSYQARYDREARALMLAHIRGD